MKIHEASQAKELALKKNSYFVVIYMHSNAAGV